MNHFTRRNALTTTLGLIGLTLILNTGCGGGDNTVTPTIDPTIGSPRRMGNLKFNLTTTKATFAKGETVPLTFTVKNVGTTTVTLRYSGSPDGYDVIYNGVRSTAIIFGSGGGSEQSLPPGQTSTFGVDWKQRDAITSVPVRAGSYQLIAYSDSNLADGVTYTHDQARQSLASNPISITVTP